MEFRIDECYYGPEWTFVDVYFKNNRIVRLKFYCHDEAVDESNIDACGNGFVMVWRDKVGL